MPGPVSRAWASWVLWTGGVTLRWAANVTGFHWRALLPVSAAFQSIAFAIFFVTVSHHKAQPAPRKRSRIETWMKLVIAATVAFLLALILNQVETVVLVASEVPAYEANLRAAWQILPVSAVTELTAVTLFAINLSITLQLPPPYPAVARPITSPEHSHQSSMA